MHGPGHPADRVGGDPVDPRIHLLRKKFLRKWMDCRGISAFTVGIAAMVLGFVLKSPGTQAGPTDPLPAPRISVFGTIHPELFRLDAPLGSGAPGERIRLASIEPQG